PVNGERKDCSTVPTTSKANAADVRQLRQTIYPVRIGPAGDAFGEISARAIHVARAEARFEKGVVEDVALRAAAAEFHDARAQAFHPLERAVPVISGKSVQPFHERHEAVAHQAVANFRVTRAGEPR